ncbi:hypothetical protein INR49_031449 [Caranx melampygus]|nr:hypothetical protein INR49_031449 [Caranx melampygus]
MKSAEGRYEIMLSVEKMLRGLGVSAVPCHRDVYKAARTCLTDRSMAVRCAAAKCLLELHREASFLWTSELENVATLCFRAFEGSTYNVRVSVAKLLGMLLAAAVEPRAPAEWPEPELSGGGDGFVDSWVPEGRSQFPPSEWRHVNFSSFLSLLMELSSHARANQTPSDAVVTRCCVTFVLRSCVSLLGEKAQTSAAKQLCLTLGGLIQDLGSTAAPLLTDSSTAILDTVISVLLHPAPSARLAAAWCLRCIATAMPSQCSPLLDRCTERLAALKSSPEAVAGYGAAVAALLASVQHCPLGIPHTKGKVVLCLAEEMLRSANQSSRISLQRTQAGPCCSGAPPVTPPPPVEVCVSCLSEGAGDGAASWGLLYVAGYTGGTSRALCAMRNLLLHCREIVTDDIISRLLTPLACAVSLLSKLPSLLRSYSSSVRSWSIVYRLRVYELLSLLPPPTYQEFGLVMNRWSQTCQVRTT